MALSALTNCLAQLAHEHFQVKIEDVGDVSNSVCIRQPATYARQVQFVKDFCHMRIT